eukprot:scaffold40784_cov75-Phaeocystis_antarctica.AAC.4
MGGGGARCCGRRRVRLDIAAPIVSRRRPQLLFGVAASPRDPATPRPRDRVTRDSATPRPAGD